MPESLINIGTTNFFPSPEPSRINSVRQSHSPGEDETQDVSAPQKSPPGEDSASTDTLDLSREAEEIRQLQRRDREVRAHEAAHTAAGGSYAGTPSYTYERGADGRTYAVGGEVSIDVSPVSGDPRATLQKAEQVRAAALAPAEPSAQDMRVAQQAQSMAAQARREISREQMDKLPEELHPDDDSRAVTSVQTVSAYSQGIHASARARLEIYA